MFEIIALFPLFPGTNELDQIERIHNVIGTPPPEILAKQKEVTIEVPQEIFSEPEEEEVQIEVPQETLAKQEEVQIEVPQEILAEQEEAAIREGKKAKQVPVEA